MQSVGTSVGKPQAAKHSQVSMVIVTVYMAGMLILSGCNTASVPQATPVPTPEVLPIPTTTHEPATPMPSSTPSPTWVRVTPTPMPTWYPTAGLNGAPPPFWREVGRIAPGKKQVALTFDAGGTGETMPQILQTLREHKVRATMFFTGRFAEQYPEGVKQAAADGHELGNHTYSHIDSRKLTDKALRQELARTDKIIHDLTGLSTKPYWRPPFGGRNNHMLNIAASEGYRSIYWTLDSHDAVGQPKTADFIFDRITNTPTVELDGAIILEHFGSQASADALPRILDRLEGMGLQVVTISELLSSP